MEEGEDRSPRWRLTGKDLLFHSLKPACPVRSAEGEASHSVGNAETGAIEQRLVLGIHPATVPQQIGQRVPAPTGKPQIGMASPAFGQGKDTAHPAHLHGHPVECIQVGSRALTGLQPLLLALVASKHFTFAVHDGRDIHKQAGLDHLPETIAEAMGKGVIERDVAGPGRHLWLRGEIGVLL